MDLNQVKDTIVGITGTTAIGFAPHIESMTAQDYSQTATLLMQAVALIATIIKLFGKKSNVQSIN